MLIIKFLSIIALVFPTAFADEETNVLCDFVNQQELFCNSRGVTGFEFFSRFQKHQMQRHLLIFENSWGSLLLLKKATPLLVDIQYQKCWIINDPSKEELTIYCNQDKKTSSRIPEIIYEDIKKSNEGEFTPSLP